MPRKQKKSAASNVVVEDSRKCPKCRILCEKPGPEGCCNNCGWIVFPCEPVKHKKPAKWNPVMGGIVLGSSAYCMIAFMTLVIASYTAYSLEQSIVIASAHLALPHWGMTGEQLLVVWGLLGVTLLGWFIFDSILQSTRCGDWKNVCAEKAGIDFNKREPVTIVLLVVSFLLIPLAGYYLLSPFALMLVALATFLVALFILFNNRRYSHSALGTIFLIVFAIAIGYITLLAGHVAFLRY